MTFQSPKAQSSLPAVPAEGHRDLLIAAFWAIMQCFPRGWEGFASCLTKSLLLLSRTLLSPLSSPEAPSPVPLSQLKHCEPTAPASLRPCSSCCPPCPRTNPPCPVPTSARALARTPRAHRHLPGKDGDAGRQKNNYNNLQPGIASRPQEKGTSQPSVSSSLNLPVLLAQTAFQ